MPDAPDGVVLDQGGGRRRDSIRGESAYLFYPCARDSGASAGIDLMRLFAREAREGLKPDLAQ
jgi:hypothetical protein